MTSAFCCNRTSYISLYQKTFSNIVFWDPLSAVESRFNKAVSFDDQNSGWKLFRIGWYPDNWPSKKIAPRWDFGFGSRLGLALGLGGVGGGGGQPDNCRRGELPLVRVCVRVSSSVGWGNFPWGQLFPEISRDFQTQYSHKTYSASNSSWTLEIET